MTKRNDHRNLTTEQKPLHTSIGHKARRKIRARKQADRNAWFWLGMFGMVGWSIAVPTLIGIALGSWLDNRWQGPPSWTLTLLFGGLVLGCIHAWYWIRQESNDG